MEYEIYIKVTNQRGDTLLDTKKPLKNLDDILSIDLALLYAEAQQSEIVNGFDIPAFDEFDELQEHPL